MICLWKMERGIGPVGVVRAKVVASGGVGSRLISRK